MEPFMKISNCPSCGGQGLKKTRGPLEVHIKKKTIMVPAIEFYRCEKCGETLTDIENEQRIDTFLSKHRKRAA